MTPQTQAKDLLVRMYNMIFDIDLGKNVSHDGKRYQAAKQCALICIDEILNTDNDFIQTEAQQQYWQKVKNEINL